MGSSLSSSKKEPIQVYQPQLPQQLISSTNTTSYLDARWMNRPPIVHQPPAIRRPSVISRPPFQPSDRYSNKYSGVGLIGRTPQREWVSSYVPAQPAPPPQIISTIGLPKSFITWTQLYQERCIPKEQLEAFNSRIKDNTDQLIKENETLAAEKRLERMRLASDIAIGRENQQPSGQSPKPSVNSYLNFESRFKCFKFLDRKYFSTEKKLPELTPHMLAEISAASKPQPPNEALVELDGVQILRKDIQTLINLNWLNDEIVNAYMNLIVLRGSKPGYKRVYAFNTFFYPKLRDSGYSSIKRWTRKVDIFCYDYILVPVHLGNHWCLAFIDFTDKSISYYDSLGGQPNGCCNIILDYLRHESSDKKKQDFDTENWKLPNKYVDGIPQQMNCSDCGVFTCTYAEYLTRGAKLEFKQKDMPYFRKKMIYEIIKKQILE